MKAKTIKLTFWFLFVTFIRFFPQLELLIEAQYFIYLAAILVSALCICLIPKRIVGGIIGGLITVGVSVYSPEYFLFALPVLLLIYAHGEIASWSIKLNETESSEIKGKNTKKNKAKNQKKSIKDFISCIICGAAVVCSGLQLVLLDTSRPREHKDSIGDYGYIIFYAVFLIALLVVALITKSTNKKPVNSQMSLQYKVFYIASFVCLALQTASIYLSAQSSTITNRVEFHYWFLFVIAIILNKDFYLDELIKKFTLSSMKDRG